MKTKIILAFTIGLIAGGFIVLLGLNWERDLPMYHRVVMSKDTLKSVSVNGDTLIWEKISGKYDHYRMFIDSPESLPYIDSVKFIIRGDTLYLGDTTHYFLAWVGADTLYIKRIKPGKNKMK